MYRFKAKYKPGTRKDVRLNILQNGYLGLLIFYDFAPQNAKFLFFSKTNNYKIRNSGDIKETLKYVLKLHTKTIMRNSKAISSFLAVQL